MKFIAWGIVFLSSVNLLLGQAAKSRVLSLPVNRGNVALLEPWMGGMNAPQFSPCDLNRDGRMDLFVFDRVGDKVLTFLNRGGNTDSSYYYAPEYEELFPSELTSWALIRDYNADNIPDIFCHANAGIAVYKGSLVDNKLHFDTVAPMLYYRDGQFMVNIYTSIEDIPVITDVNRDGDLDILTYGIFGATVEYYENQTKEHAGDSYYAMDSLRYDVITYCWGGFTENALNNSIEMNVSCKGGRSIINEGAPRHSGSTIFNLDYDNDHDVDLLIGDVSFSNMVLVNNCGDSSYAHICTWDSAFPSCNTPVNLRVFPAAFGVDADNDGMQDLLIAPNARIGAQDQSNVLLYRNNGNAQCNFNYSADTFLTNQWLDLGTDSKPVFFDFNGDGLVDIVAGGHGRFDSASYQCGLAIFLNTGTPTHPAFRQSTLDYNSFSAYGLTGLHPAFGDLTGDGKPDMILGESTGAIHFCKNTGSAAANFVNISTPAYFGIDAGLNSAPFIFDLNGDSLNDIIVGKRDGRLNYYWNFGTKTAPLFSPDSVNTALGNIRVTLYGQTEGNCVPFITRDTAGEIHLYAGSHRGNVFEYLVNTDSLLAGTFRLIDSNIIKYDVGSKATIAIADINADGHAEYLLGNSRGGMLLYSDSAWEIPTALPVPLQAGATISVYPNPANSYFKCVLSQGDFSKLRIALYNVLGESMNIEKTVAENVLTVATHNLARGIYILRINTTNGLYSSRVVIE